MILDKSVAVQPLSHDEAKAAEAAFQGRPFNEDWSESARLVYDGLCEAIRKRTMERLRSQAVSDSECAFDTAVLSLHEALSEEPSVPQNG